MKKSMSKNFLKKCFFTRPPKIGPGQSAGYEFYQKHERNGTFPRVKTPTFFGVSKKFWVQISVSEEVLFCFNEWDLSIGLITYFFPIFVVNFISTLFLKMYTLNNGITSFYVIFIYYFYYLTYSMWIVLTGSNSIRFNF